MTKHNLELIEIKDDNYKNHKTIPRSLIFRQQNRLTK